MCVAAHSRAAGTQSGCAADRDERRGARSSSLATCAARRVAASRRAAPLAETDVGLYSKGLSLRNREIETETLILASISQR